MPYKITIFRKYIAEDIFQQSNEIIKYSYYYSLIYNNLPFLFFTYKSDYSGVETFDNCLEYLEYGIIDNNSAYFKYRILYNINFNNIYINIL
jgi:hypothetical protein